MCGATDASYLDAPCDVWVGSQHDSLAAAWFSRGQRPTLGLNMVEKKPGNPGFFSMPAVSLGENSLTETAAHMSQLGKRKFLNFNNGFNNCRVHSNPLLREENTFKNRDYRSGSLGAQFLKK